VSQGQPNEDRFVAEVRRQAERAQAARHMTFWQGLGVVGSVGWMVSLPAVVGALLGRWIDAHCSSGIFWTLSLLTAGLGLGCLTAWHQTRKELKG
jgi:ATP synthase protein I